MYLYQKPNEDTSTAVPDDTLYQVDPVNTIANGYNYNYMALPIPDQEDRLLAIRFSRIGADAEDTADAIVNLLYMCLEYTMNKLGD